MLIYNNSIVRLCGIVTCTALWLTRNFTLQNNTAHNERNDTDRTRLREVPRIHNRGNCFTSCILTRRVAFNLTITTCFCHRRIIFRSWWERTFLKRSGDSATWSSAMSRRYTSSMVSISYGNWNNVSSRQWMWDNVSLDTWVSFFFTCTLIIEISTNNRFK